MIPRAALRQRVKIEPFLGNGAYGPQYGAEQEDVPARFDGRRRVVRKADGTDLVASGTLEVRPTVAIPEESRVTIPHTVTGEGVVYEVVGVLPAEGLTRPWSQEVLLS